MTKLTWDNAILIGPKMAERLKIASKDVVELELNGKKVTGAVWIQAGHPDNSITVTLGYGRTRAGRIGTVYGFDAYPLRTSARAVVRQRRANPQDRRELRTGLARRAIRRMDTPDGDFRPLVRIATLEEYKKEPNFAQEDENPPAGSHAL